MSLKKNLPMIDAIRWIINLIHSIINPGTAEDKNVKDQENMENAISEANPADIRKSLDDIVRRSPKG